MVARALFAGVRVGLGAGDFVGITAVTQRSAAAGKTQDRPPPARGAVPLARDRHRMAETALAGSVRCATARA
jgi:hypothetical protein